MYIVLHASIGESTVYVGCDEINVAKVTIGENTMYGTQ